VIIEEVVAMKEKLKPNGLQDTIDAFIGWQVLIPGKWQRHGCVPSISLNFSYINIGECKKQFSETPGGVSSNYPVG
jgi:hypothetical protein